MGWPQSFIDTLDQPSKEIHFALKFLPNSLDYNFSKGDQVNESSIIYLSNAEGVIDTVQVTPQRWSVNFGGFSVQIVGDLRPLINSSFRKGAVAELLMNRNGIVSRVCVGQLRNISGGRGVWNLQFVDFLTMMQTRLTKIVTQAQFWYNAGKDTF